MRNTIGMMLTLAVMTSANLNAKEAKTGTIITPLQEYVNAPDDSYQWKVRGESIQHGCTVVDIGLTSQTWHDMKWEHTLSLFLPPKVKHKNTVLLFITGGQTGGRVGESDLWKGTRLATLAQMPCVFLHHVPNQPLLGGRVEDDLITETFLKYLETKDTTWPLLFPMVKSAVRAMDAVSEIAKQHFETEINQFVVAGVSKRGWTSWLTAAVDPRVAGVAPIVIDMPNLQPQLEGQLERWGKYSEQIIDYTSKGLVKKVEEDADYPLWGWVDPYTYREHLTMPKLLINGTNDRYWVVDAMNQYWDGLVGLKYALYVPNAGHDLGGGVIDAFTTLAIFSQRVATKTPLPVLSWKHDDEGEKFRLSVESNEPTQRFRLWIAKSESTDFRSSKWTAINMDVGIKGKAVALVEPPASGHIAFYAEATYSFGPSGYGLSTQIRVE